MTKEPVAMMMAFFLTIGQQSIHIQETPNRDICNLPFEAGNKLMKNMIKEHKMKTYDVLDFDYCGMEFETTNK